jgi:hypothetical protein
LKGGPLLEKPFTRAALLNAIHTILGSNSHQPCPG